MVVIAVDTGNRYIKTAHAEPFSAGLNMLGDTPPIVNTDTLFYNGNYYSFAETQGYHRQDKTVDNYYFILTLAAIAREIVMKDAIAKSPIGATVDFKQTMKDVKLRNAEFNENVFLSVGLPPRDMKAQSKRLKEYYMRDGELLHFTYNGMKFNICITDVCVSPQGFAAVFPNDMFNRVASAPQAYIIDIGGYTTDVARIANKRIDTAYFESLDFGVINMYNEIASIVGREHQKNINGILIEAILHGESIGDKAVEETVRKGANNYAHKIIAALRDKGVDLSLSLPVLVGGGVQLMRNALEDAINRNEVYVIPDIRANAIGYEVLVNRILKEKNRVG